MTDHIRHYRALVAEIERDFPVAGWRCGDLDLWPLARIALHHDMHLAATGEVPPRRRSAPLRLTSLLARPLMLLWRARHDLAHLVLWPKPAFAVLLGDGTTLDRVDGAFQDRFGEAVMAALEKGGRRSFLMQQGDLSRLPWRRPTFPADLIQAWAALLRPLFRRELELPCHDGVLDLLRRAGVTVPSLERKALAVRAREVRAAAALFGLILDRVKPTLAFAVTYYAGLAPAFLLACRRREVRTVDLQRGSHEGAPQAYAWGAMPEKGYSTLPGIFWCWTPAEAAAMPPPCRGIPGGHAQLAPFLDDAGAQTRACDAQYFSIAGPSRCEREILVALQPIAGCRHIWDAVADAIATAPAGWRWWLRRHPAMQPAQDGAFGRLLALRQPNVVIDAPLPLPALLRHMDVLVSLRSGSAVEAAMFQVPSLFLDASAPFPSLLNSGMARFVAPGSLAAAIAALPVERKPQTALLPMRALADVIEQLTA